MWAERVLSFETFRTCLREDPPGGWLSPAEAQRLAELRAPARRLSWLGGRWLVKEMLGTLAADPPAARSELHIESRDARDRGSRPRVFLRGRLQPWYVSIAHAPRHVYVAVAHDRECQVGVDVTPRRPLSAGFLDFWLTPAERAWCRRQHDAEPVCLVWSLKESWYKAEGGKQPFSPQRWDMSQVAARLWPDGRQCDPDPNAAGGVARWSDSESVVVYRSLPGEIATLVVRYSSRPRGRSSPSSAQAGPGPGWTETILTRSS